jgi:anion-transporting  ArsA/GET3 family ATPase
VTDSYLGYLDIIQFSNLIINLGSRYIEERRKTLLKMFDEVKNRIDKCFTFVSNFPYQSLIIPVKNQLEVIQANSDKIWGMFQTQFPDRSKEIFTPLEGLNAQLGQIESKLKKKDNTRQVLQFASRFLMKNLIFQGSNLIIALILFPILAYYINFLLPGLSLSPQSIWGYQKILLALGGISGLFLSVAMAAKDIAKI